MGFMIDLNIKLSQILEFFFSFFAIKTTMRNDNAFKMLVKSKINFIRSSEVGKCLAMICWKIELISFYCE